MSMLGNIYSVNIIQKKALLGGGGETEAPVLTHIPQPHTCAIAYPPPPTLSNTNAHEFHKDVEGDAEGRLPEVP